jgi:hypothetical protein
MDAGSSSLNPTPMVAVATATTVAAANAPTTATTAASPATLPGIAVNPAKMTAGIPAAVTGQAAELWNATTVVKPVILPVTAQSLPRDVTQGKEVAAMGLEVVDLTSNAITVTIWVISLEIALSQSARGMTEGPDVGPGPDQGLGPGPLGVGQSPSLILATDAAVARKILGRKDVEALPQDLGQAGDQEALAQRVGPSEAARKKGQEVLAPRVGPRMSKRIEQPIERDRDHQASQPKDGD